MSAHPQGTASQSCWRAAARLRGTGRAVGWLTCTRHHDNLHLLWTDILAAIAGGLDAAGLPWAGLAELSAPQAGEEAQFLEELAFRLGPLPGPFTLVLDDVHRITIATTRC